MPSGTALKRRKAAASCRTSKELRARSRNSELSRTFEAGSAQAASLCRDGARSTGFDPVISREGSNLRNLFEPEPQSAVQVLTC